MVEDKENSTVTRKKSLPAPEGVNGFQIVRLDFVDDKTSQVVKSFDVYANSPFEKLGFPVTGVNFEGGSIYMVDKVLPGDSGLYLNKSSMFLDSMPGVPFEVFSLASVDGEGKNFTAVTYRMQVKKEYKEANEDSNQKVEISTSYNSLIVLNNHGEVIQEIDNLDVGFYPPVTSENGKYVAFIYEECDNEECEPPVRHGLKFVSLNDGKIIDFAIPISERIIGRATNEHNRFRFETNLGWKPVQTIFRVFDLEEREAYEKPLLDERKYLYAITSSGLTFKDGARTWRYSFQNDFQKIKIPEP
jgi:hypothetical protein